MSLVRIQYLWCKVSNNVAFKLLAGGCHLGKSLGRGGSASRATHVNISVPSCPELEPSLSPVLLPCRVLQRFLSWPSTLVIHGEQSKRGFGFKMEATVFL